MSDMFLSAGDIDPEIADLLGDEASPASVPDFSDLFDEPAPVIKEQNDVPTEDISKENFETLFSVYSP